MEYIHEPTRSLLSVAECADLLRLSTRTIRRWITEGRLSATRTTPGLGGRLLVKRSDLLAVVGLDAELKPFAAGTGL